MAAWYQGHERLRMRDNINSNCERRKVDEDVAETGIEISNPSKFFSIANDIVYNKNERALLIPPRNSAANYRQQRLVSLDVFRGITVALMILVDNAGGLLPSINHSPWNGLTLADFVMPFFLFTVGVSLGLTYKKVPSGAAATRKAVLRALKLLLLGIFLQGGFFHGLKDLSYGVDIERIRWMGILQRIAIAYFVAAMCEVWLKSDDDNQVRSLTMKYRFHWAMAMALIVIYTSLLYGLYVPDWDWEYAEGPVSNSTVLTVRCGVRGDTGPACNAVGMVDRNILGIKHLYHKPIYRRTKECSVNSPDYGPPPAGAPSWCQAPFEPEGLLSSVMAVVTCLVGLQFGHVILHFKDHEDRVSNWIVWSTWLVALGFVLHMCGMHVSKPLYTVSYMCVTAGAAGVVFAGIYLVVDVWGYKRTAFVFEWMGLHALAIYIFVACNVLPLFIQGFYWKYPQNNIFRLIEIGK